MVIKMNKTIIILLLLMIPIHSMFYAMPVPSEPVEKGPIPVQGGGALSATERHVFIAFMTVGLILLLDKNENNDNWGLGCCAVGVGVWYFMGW